MQGTPIIHSVCQSSLCLVVLEAIAPSGVWGNSKGSPAVSKLSWCTNFLQDLFFALEASLGNLSQCLFHPTAVFPPSLSNLSQCLFHPTDVFPPSLSNLSQCLLHPTAVFHPSLSNLSQCLFHPTSVFHPIRCPCHSALDLLSVISRVHSPLLFADCYESVWQGCFPLCPKRSCFPCHHFCGTVVLLA